MPKVLALVRIYVCLTLTDMRRSLDSLAAVVREEDWDTIRCRVLRRNDERTLGCYYLPLPLSKSSRIFLHARWQS
jgi:hypothetical protein